MNSKAYEQGYTQANEMIKRHSRTVDVTDSTIAFEVMQFANNIVAKIRDAERAKSELDSIRATLLVNYGPGKTLDGIEVDESLSTTEMLTRILRSYNIKVK